MYRTGCSFRRSFTAGSARLTRYSLPSTVSWPTARRSWCWCPAIPVLASPRWCTSCTRCSSRREGQRRDYRIEKRYRRKDGNVIWADLSSTLVPATGSAPAFFASVVVDITERKRAEEELRESEQRLQDIVDNTTAVVFVKDLDLRYLLVNREYERRHRLRRDQILGKTDIDIHPPEVAEAVRNNDRHVIEAGAPIQFEETVPSDGGERAYVSAKFLLRDRIGKPYAVCGIATDITESKRAEEMRAAMARERELFAQQRATQF